MIRMGLDRVIAAATVLVATAMMLWVVAASGA